MIRKVLLASILAATAMGCATGNRAYMDSALQNQSEPARVWNRPQEVGFDWGAEVNAEASQSCILYVFCWGAEGGGIVDGVGALVGGILGRSGPVSDPLVRAAAAIAVQNTPNADGIYVVSHQTERVNYIVFQTRSATVKGKAITIRPIGEVSEERSDRNRNLNAIGGGALINTPMDAIK